MNKLTQALTEVQALLWGVSLNSKLPLILSTAFGNNYNISEVDDIFSSWRNKDFSNFPQIEVLSARVMNDAQGAYSALNNTIYLSSSLLELKSVTEIIDVIIEEIGHFIDAQINNIDSLGDEGAIFSALVTGKTLDNETLQALKNENDWATIEIDEQLIAIEMQSGTSTSGNDTIIGTAGADFIQGLDGNDSLMGLDGNDTLEGGNGNDTLIGDNGNDFIHGGSGTNILSGGDGDDTLIPATGSSVDDGSSVNGGSGIDTLIMDFSNADNSDLNVNGLGIYNHTFGISTLYRNIRLLNVSNIEIFNITGTIYNDSLTVKQGDNFNGGAGFDTLNLNFSSATTNVNLKFDRNNTTNQLVSGNAIVKNFEGIGEITTGIGNDIIDIGNGNGVDNAGTINGGSGIDTLIVDFSNADHPDLNVNGLGIYNHTFGISTLYRNIRLLNISNIEIFNITGTIYNDSLTVRQGDNFDGGAGFDTLNLNFFSATTNVNLKFDRNNTTNQLVSGNAIVKNFEGIGEIITGIGNDIIDIGNGNGVDNAGTINGGSGIDTLIVDFTNADNSDLNVNGLGIYNHTFGISTLYRNIRLLNVSNIEIFNITGTIYNDSLTVRQGDNFNGGAGFDTLNLNFSSATTNVNLKFDRNNTTNQLVSGNAIVKNFEGIGEITTGIGNDIIDIGNGNGVDNAGTINGGSGIDTLIVDFSNADHPDLNVNGLGIYNHTFGISTLYRNIRLLNVSNIEIFNITGTLYNDQLRGFELNDTLNGGSGNDSLNGFGGDDYLDGGNGVDTMTGGVGNDIYIVDNISDRVIENANEGTDTVRSTITYTLSDHVENLILEGTANRNGTGNSDNNRITGNSGKNSLNGGNGNDTLMGEAGNDTLNGGTGADSMLGGIANDTYYVDNTGDRVIENANEGIDIVISTISYTLSNHVENLTLNGTGNINGTGNVLDNNIVGNSGNNNLNGGTGNDTLNGGTGVDTMVGGLGNDTYYVDNTLDHEVALRDRVIENVNEGIDTVISTTTYTLLNHVENMILQSRGNFNGTGNDLNNNITGNNGNNYLNGGNGNDTLTGNAGNDTLNGGTGADMMLGGLANDTYYVDNTGDQVIENTNQGTDTVRSIVTYTLGNNLENLILEGSANINGSGNILNNSITGNSANNRLNGGDGNDTLTGNAGNDTLNGDTGADRMLGGLGNDNYYVDNTGDQVIENTNQGTDTVRSIVTYTLGNNLENLILEGSANINGTGNILNNSITGNSGNNRLNGENGNDTLTGGNGNDTLAGGVGNDILTGGAGNDFFSFNSFNEGFDRITDFNVVEDTILISRSGFGVDLPLGVLSANRFVVGSSPTTADHRFLYNANNGDLFFDVDGSGVTSAVRIATLNTGLAMTNADIVLI